MRGPRSRFAAALLLCLGTGLLACADGEEDWKAARADYAALVEAGAHPADKRYDAVLERLAKIPKGSKYEKDAQAMQRGILAVRKALPPRPLAAVPVQDGGAPSEYQSRQAACAALAMRLGQVDAGERDRVVEALATCRRELEELKAHDHPEPDPP